MARYQFAPRDLHVLDKGLATQVASFYGASRIMEVYPDMKDANGKRWRGTNQPRTIAFTATPEQAQRIKDAYGEDAAFIWCVDNGGHYI